MQLGPHPERVRTMFKCVPRALNFSRSAGPANAQHRSHAPTAVCKCASKALVHTFECSCRRSWSGNGLALEGTAAGLEGMEVDVFFRDSALDAVSKSGAISGKTKGRFGVLGMRDTILGGEMSDVRRVGVPSACRCLARASVAKTGAWSAYTLG